MSIAYRLAYLVSHPIQYHAPLLRALHADPGIELKVFFRSDMGTDSFYDPEFKKEISWGKNLLEGYDYEYLPALGGRSRLTLLRPFSFGLFSRLLKGEFDAIWIHGYGRPYNVLATVQAKTLGIPVFIRDDATLNSRKRSSLKRLLKTIFFKFFDPFVSGYLCVGSMNRAYFKEYGISDEKLFTVPYAVDNEYFQSAIKSAGEQNSDLRKELGLKEDEKVVLFVGKLIPQKDPFTLLRAFAELLKLDSNAILVIVGDGALRVQMEELIGKLGIEGRVRIVGFINQQELPRYYNLCDLLVLPSINETWGLVVNEVMNGGKPVVVSSHAGCSVDLISAGENGEIFQAGNESDLTRALHNIVRDDSTRRSMGEKSSQRIKEFNFHNNVSQVKAAFSHLLPRKGVAE